MTPMAPQEVKDARLALGLTQQQLANALDLESTWSKDTVRAWEKGHRPITGPARVALRLMLQLHHIKATKKAKVS